MHGSSVVGIGYSKAGLRDGFAVPGVPIADTGTREGEPVRACTHHAPKGPSKVSELEPESVQQSAGEQIPRASHGAFVDQRLHGAKAPSGRGQLHTRLGLKSSRPRRRQPSLVTCVARSMQVQRAAPPRHYAVLGPGVGGQREQATARGGRKECPKTCTDTDTKKLGVGRIRADARKVGGHSGGTGSELAPVGSTRGNAATWISAHDEECAGSDGTPDCP